MLQKRLECFRLLLEHLAWIEHQLLGDIRDSRKPGSLWGMMRGVGGVRKSIHQSWLAKGLGLGLLCWGFKGVQQEIPSEEAIYLKIKPLLYSGITIAIFLIYGINLYSIHFSNKLLIALIKLSVGKYFNISKCILYGTILLLISNLDDHNFIFSSY